MNHLISNLLIELYPDSNIEFEFDNVNNLYEYKSWMVDVDTEGDYMECEAVLDIIVEKFPHLKNLVRVSTGEDVHYVRVSFCIEK